MKRRGWSKDQERKRRGEGMSNEASKTIHIPEVMDDLNASGNHTEMMLTESGTLPALRSHLREALGGFQARQSWAIDEIIKTTAAETEFLEKVAKQRRAQYVDTVKFHEKLGA